MIAIGCSITKDDLFDAYAGPSIESIREPDTKILMFPSAGSIFRSYNIVLDQAAKIEGLDALVLLHQDAEIVDPEFLDKVRRSLMDPEVALVGSAGANNVRSIAWWEGENARASHTQRFQDFGGGEIPAIRMTGKRPSETDPVGEVDVIDGVVMALSSWAVRNLRFDESIGGEIHGYDFDLCMQARAAGKKVVTQDFRVVHHHSLEPVGEVEGWIDTHMKLSRKWNDQLPGAGQPVDWEERALRAEAELSATRLNEGAAAIIWEANVKHLERDVKGIERSASWRLTRPLRSLGRLGKSKPDRRKPDRRD